MPSLDTIRRITSQKNNGAKTIGQIHKENSDFVMEQLWNNDIQSRTCYIYDYLHDDQPELKDHMTYENTTKTKIDAKFIISSYGSIDKDQVAYHLMFRPSQPIEFDQGDELYYYETDYRKRYDMRFPIGLMCDIPDEKGVYVKWLIIDYEESNQFMKYTILPCDYRLQWISIEGNKRVKRQMWCCTRAANSYTSGRWLDRYVLSLDDINKILIPLNPITENLGYIDKENVNQRIILSAKIPNPLTWQISKVENTKPIGIIKITLDQDVFNPHTDFIERDNDGNIIGMWADYYSSEITPSVPVEDNPIIQPQNLICMLSSSNNNLKIGGSYKLITMQITDDDNLDKTIDYSSSIIKWNCFIDGEDYTDSDLVKWLVQPDFNKIKIKFGTNRSYLNKLLTVKCTVDDKLTGEIQLELII